MSFDNCCKLLAEKYPEQFASWLLGQPTQSVEVLKTELSIEPIRADSVILLRTQGRILHIKFQVKLESEPPLPLRFLDYWVRLYRLFRVPIVQVLILLRPPAEGTEIESAFVMGTTRHEYRVVKSLGCDVKVVRPAWESYSPWDLPPCSHVTESQTLPTLRVSNEINGMQGTNAQ
jgi:predicted transposase YdaD